MGDRWAGAGGAGGTDAQRSIKKIIKWSCSQEVCWIVNVNRGLLFTLPPTPRETILKNVIGNKH